MIHFPKVKNYLNHLHKLRIVKDLKLNPKQKTKNRLFRICYKLGDSNKLLLYKSYSNKLTYSKENFKTPLLLIYSMNTGITK